MAPSRNNKKEEEPSSSIQLLNEEKQINGDTTTTTTTATTDDDRSIESLLSDWDESDDETVAKRVKRKQRRRRGKTRRQRLEQKFALRQKILERLVEEGKPTAYIQMLQYHEELVRTETFRLLEQDEKKNMMTKKKNDDDDNNNNANNDTQKREKEAKDDDATLSKTAATNEIEGTPNINSSSTHTTTSFLTIIKHLIVFETGCSIPAFLCVMFYCFGHLALYEIVYSAMGECSRYFNISYEFVCATAILISFVLLRLTGGLWEWSSIPNHAAAKFELHNRIRMGYWDARIHRWFRQTQPSNNKCNIQLRTLRKLVEFLALYMCCASVAHFQYLVLVPFTSDRTWVLEQLPSNQYGETIPPTPVKLWLQGMYTVPCDDNDDAQEHEECRLFDRLTIEDDAAVNDMISTSSYARLFGDSKAHVLTPLTNEVYYICFAFISFFFMYWFGAQLYD